MKTFEIRHSDGTLVVIEAENEAMARQFAMEDKHGTPTKNRAWSSTGYMGLGLSVKEMPNVNT